MASYNIFSLNIGMSSSLAGLSSLVESENIDIVFMQEVRLSSEQIEQTLHGFKAAVNIDPNNLTKPGIALAWRESVPLTDVVSFDLCRLQVASLGSLKLVNLYAPSGTNNRYARTTFFSQELFNIL